MLKVIHLNEKQAKEVNDLYNQAGSCSLCVKWMEWDEQKFLITQPQSDRGSVPRTLKTNSLCSKCGELIKNSMQKRYGINKPKIKLES